MKIILEDIDNDYINEMKKKDLDAQNVIANADSEHLFVVKFKVKDSIKASNFMLEMISPKNKKLISDSLGIEVVSTGEDNKYNDIANRLISISNELIDIRNDIWYM